MSVVVVDVEELRRILREELQRVRAPAQGSTEDRRVNSTDAAAAAGVCAATVRAWAAAGRIKRYGEGRGVRYSLAEVLSVAPVDAPDESAASWAERKLGQRHG